MTEFTAKGKEISYSEFEIKRQKDPEGQDSNNTTFNNKYFQLICIDKLLLLEESKQAMNETCSEAFV